MTWWRVGLWLLALGMVAGAVVLVVTVPRVTFSLSGKPTTDVCSSPWQSWRTGNSVVNPQGDTGPSPTYVSKCSAADSDRWHLGWVLAPGAVVVFLGSLVSRFGVRRYSPHKAHPAKT